jgi:hypothetical protein
MIDVAECKVSLWLCSDTLDPDELALWLGQLPTYQIRKGETYQSKDGEEMVASTGQFQLWDKIKSKMSGEVICGLILDSVNEEAKISPDTLLALGSRGLSLHLDIYDSGDGPISSTVRRVLN